MFLCPCICLSLSPSIYLLIIIYLLPVYYMHLYIYVMLLMLYGCFFFIPRKQYHLEFFLLPQLSLWSYFVEPQLSGIYMTNLARRAVGGTHRH